MKTLVVAAAWIACLTWLLLVTRIDWTSGSEITGVWIDFRTRELHLGCWIEHRRPYPPCCVLAVWNGKYGDFHWPWAFVIDRDGSHIQASRRVR